MGRLFVVQTVVLVSVLLLAGCGDGKHRAVTVGWAKTYGGTGNEYLTSFQQTTDDGYVLAGYTESFGVSGRHFWVVKLDADQSILWQKRYGGAGDNYLKSIQQTSDSGYIVAGQTNAFGAGSSDFWVLKMNSDGTIDWQKTYGGTAYDGVNSIQETPDGGYIVAGYTGSFGAGSSDIWVLKLNSDGSVAWQKTYGTTFAENAREIRQTDDGGYIVAGESLTELWVLKLDSNGAVTWQKRYGGSEDEYMGAIRQTSDGGYIVTATTHSFGTGDSDFWVIKLYSDGAVAWQKRYGGSDNDWANSIQQTSDGGYIAAGWTRSFGAGDADCWVLKLNADGTIAWQKGYGGSDNDFAVSVQQTSDGGYIVAGETDSFGAGGRDFWLLKLNSTGTIVFNPASGASVTDTDVLPIDTTCPIVTSGVTPVNSAVTPTNSNATAVNTDGTVEQQAP